MKQTVIGECRAIKYRGICHGSDRGDVVHEAVTRLNQNDVCAFVQTPRQSRSRVPTTDDDDTFHDAESTRSEGYGVIPSAL
jgi:hypothetical protein